MLTTLERLLINRTRHIFISVMLAKFLFFLTFGVIGWFVPFITDVIIFSVTSNAEYTDRKCGDSIADLWLEVVLLIDNSNGMTDQSMYDVCDILIQKEIQ